MPTIGRLIPLAAGDPIDNMAIDQALLLSTSRGGMPTLRVYQWTRPTLSLGYFQKLADRSLHPTSHTIDCVRRSTGGGAIVHHHELTYSMILPVGDSVGPHFDLYGQIHGAVQALLRSHGVVAVPFRELSQSVSVPQVAPFLCFQRRTAEDLIVSGYKVLGSAQRKVRGAVLQHGSLLLRSSRWAPQLPGIAELTSRYIEPESLAAELADQISKRLDITWADSPLTDAERREAKGIAERKFGSPHWHERR